jgi:DNA polymerase
VILELVDDAQRWVGKQAVLGLGYQMGWERFQSQCADNGVTISDELAKHVVDTYRKKYHRVKDYWEKVNDAALFAVRSGQPIVCGKVTFFVEGDFLKIRLPSGRCISYYKPHFVPSRFDKSVMALAYWGMDSQKHQWCSIGLYGGKITENIVQGIAACVLRVATINCEVGQLPVVLSVHDELVVEVLDHPQYTVALLISLLVTMPSWADGIPLAATGWEGMRFKK